MPTVSLCSILKNEINNIDRLLSSVKGCVDEIHFVDTGSTDGSIELLEKYAAGENPAGAKLHLHHFQWVNDFSAARNFSFSKATTDYILWMDLDDSLENPQGFIDWKNQIMALADYWLATYHYALDKSGKPICSFARERVVRRDKNFRWNYFVHEGLAPSVQEPFSTLYVTNWSILHHRTAEDLAKDKGRNLRLFEANQDKIDSRMLYYWGKELFENGKHLEAYTKLVEAAKKEDLDSHDRTLAIQYGATAAQLLKHPEEAIDLAIRGLQLNPTRAEFFIIVGDSYLQQNKLAESIPYFEAAKKCPKGANKGQFGFIYTHEGAYGYWPRVQLARVKFQVGDIEGALKEAEEALELQSNDEINAIHAEILRVKNKTKIACPQSAEKTTDIVITCPPGTLYEWDEEGYKTKGYGGSETAAIEIARNLHEVTNRKVIVFNGRTNTVDYGGVEYRPTQEVVEYMREKVPAAHVAWRHTERLSLGKTWVWLHDMSAPGLERLDNYDRVLCLSGFQARYVQSLFGVPPERIDITRNGINPKRWDGADFTKVGNRVIYSSSPDRGLERVLRVMDLVVKEVPDATLEIFYGWDNLIKMGQMDFVKHIQQMLNSRPWATFHGNVDQARLTKEMLKSKTWLYPTSFTESYCITGIEMILSRVHPVVRKYGALPDTLGSFEGVDIIDRDCQSIDDIAFYASRVVESLKENKWASQAQVDVEKLSWGSVAKEWASLMGLSRI